MVLPIPYFTTGLADPQFHVLGLVVARVGAVGVVVVTYKLSNFLTFFLLMKPVRGALVPAVFF